MKFLQQFIIYDDDLDENKGMKLKGNENVVEMKELERRTTSTMNFIFISKL